jgi:glycosyltransferase involved in cell wall biosynthesis
MADPVLVSIIVPCFNNAKTIGLCIEAVQAQTYPRIEVIIVDDESADGTADIASRYDCTVIRLPRRSRTASARNRGIQASRGGILFFLDADVALAPEAVGNAVRILDQHPECGGVWGVYGDRPLIDDGVVERVQILHGRYRQLRKLGPARTGHVAGGAVRRRVVDEVGGFDEQLGHISEDIELSLRIGERYPMIRSDAVVGYHDDDDKVAVVIRKCFGRGIRLVPLVLARRGARVEREATHRPQAVAAVFLGTVTVPLVLVSGYLAIAPIAFLAWYVGTNLPWLAYVRRQAGWRLVPPSLALNYTYSLTIAVAALGGLLWYLADPRFRRHWAARPAIPRTGR